MTKAKKLIDVCVGDRVIGIGKVESVRNNKGVITLAARNLGLPNPDAEDAVSTYIWKGDQLVDVADD